jgi:hypothetical protein
MKPITIPGVFSPAEWHSVRCKDWTYTAISLWGLHKFSTAEEKKVPLAIFSLLYKTNRFSTVTSRNSWSGTNREFPQSAIECGLTVDGSLVMACSQEDP